MNRVLRFLALLSVLLIALAFAGPALAQDEPDPERMPVAEFREKYLVYMVWLDASTGGKFQLESKIRAMSDAEFQALYNAFADPDGLIELSEQIMSPKEQAQTLPGPVTLAPKSPSLLTPVFARLYEPEYPEGWDYGNYIHSLQGMHLLLDWDMDGEINNDRCQANGEAQNAIATHTFKAAVIVAEALCEADPEPISHAILAAAAGVAKETALASEIVDAQCSFQGGQVDSAELEAAYENTIGIFNMVEDLTPQMETKFGEVQGTLNTQYTNLMNFMASHDQMTFQRMDEMRWQIDMHASGIHSTLNTQHNALMALVRQNQGETTTQIETHDADIKSLLQAQQAQALKIEIEKALADANDNKRLSAFYLPQAHGGMLELVRQTVQEAIEANQAAGISTGSASAWFQKAEASFAKKAYKEAYDQYAKAYWEVVK